MIYLFITVTLCLLVPWLPYLIYRQLPRRPPPPLGEGQLQCLAADLQQRADAPRMVEVRLVEDDESAADIQCPDRSAPDVPATPTTESEGSKEYLKPGAGPVRATPAAPGPRLALSSYWWAHAVFVPIFPLTFLALGWGWAALFHYLAEAHARSFQPAVFLIKPFPYRIIFALPAILLGIFSSYPLLMLLARLLMGRRRFLEYLYWDEGRFGAANTEGLIRTLGGFALFVSMLSPIFVWQVMSWYARFTEDGIAIKRFFGFGEKVYPYSSVQQIVLTSHYNQDKQHLAVPRQDVHIRFLDGRTWESDETFCLPDGAERDRFLDFLHRQTGKPILRARLITDVPGW